MNEDNRGAPEERKAVAEEFVSLSRRDLEDMWEEYGFEDADFYYYEDTFGEE